MKKNNKGFMLIELIITSTVVVTAMITLYASFNKIYSLYKTRNNYYSIDGTYAAKETVRFLMKDNIFADLINKKLGNENYTFLISNAKCNFNDGSNEQGKCETIRKFYNIKNMILAEYDKCILALDQCVGPIGNNSEEISNEEPSTDESTTDEPSTAESTTDETAQPASETEKKDLKILQNENINQTLKDYLKYVTKHYNTNTNERYDYIIITEMEENKGKLYYSNLGIR